MRLRTSGGVTALAAIWLAAILTVGRMQAAAPPQQTTAAPAGPAAAQQAVLQRYCLTCHNQTLKERGTVPIAFDKLNLSNVGTDAEVWEKVVRKVRTGLMPPAGRTRPDTATHDAFVNWIESQLDQFPLRYLHGTPPKRIAAHLQAVGRLQAGEVLVEESFNEELATCEYTVITHDNLTPGIFYKIAGVMAAQGVQILDALIITRHDGVVVDTFQVSDPDYAGVIPVERRASIAETIVRVLKGEEEEVDRLMSRNTRLFAVRRLPTVRQATEVQVLNELSDRFTIIDVYAEDTQGLLYTISRSIFQLGLSVHAARISLRQELDQVADVFYVTDQHGAKIKDQARLEAIRTTIKTDIDLFMDQQVAGSEDVSTGSAA